MSLNRPMIYAISLLAVATVSIGSRRPSANRQHAEAIGASTTIAADACTAERVGTSIPVSAIGEPVSAVALAAPKWIEPAGSAAAYCSVDGSMAPVDPAPTARSINFRVLLPAAWNRRGAQIGGGGFNGVIPNLAGPVQGVSGATPLQRGFLVYGSDSGHSIQGPVDWALNDEVMKNLGYMQMKKTHDAAMMIAQRVYGERPRFSYYFGTSQGGREALTVAQRYPADYDGLIVNVPIVNFSTLMLAPELIRIQERALGNWVPPAKVEAIRAEFVRQCDALDGLADGIMNDYPGCRAMFDITQGPPNRHPWATKRCPDGVDPNPADTAANACLTDGQISTLEFIYRRYRFSTPLANGVRSFGMWLPNTDPSGSGLLVATRYRGQEGAAADAPLHAHLGVLGVTGFLMQNLAANPLDYVEGGPLNHRRIEISASLDGTNPDLTAFRRRGGRLIVTVGTNDTLASPGAQLDYFQAVIDRMGRTAVDTFARFFVIPQVGHGLSGMTYARTGAGGPVPAAAIPNNYDRLIPLMDWVENGVAPAMSLIVTAGDRSLPLCSYPTFPKYIGGPVGAAASYRCAP
jgi:pimeloyl-ACP methyl ester carboxylesterase